MNHDERNLLVTIRREIDVYGPEKKVAAFLAEIGYQSYEVVPSLPSPKEKNDMALELPESPKFTVAKVLGTIVGIWFWVSIIGMLISRC